MSRGWKFWAKAGAGVFAVLLVLAVVGTYFVIRLEPDPNELEVGAPAPEVSLTSVEGQPFSLSAVQQAGLPVLVFYRGHW